MRSEGFTTREVIEFSGATGRQLQWWDEHRLISPARQGRNRLYSRSDLAEILVVLELRRRHISLHQIRRVLRFLKRDLQARLADLVLEEGDRPLPDYHLLIDGDRLYLETGTEQIFDLLRNTQQAVFLISLRASARKLQVEGATLAQAGVEDPRKPVASDRQPGGKGRGQPKGGEGRRRVSA